MNPETVNLKNTLTRCVSEPGLHAKLLNTLSLMENCGARKIAACEHPEHVTLMVLKHAAEEFRHAYYLKRQIHKLGPDLCAQYRAHELLVPRHSRSYLQRLDVAVCRHVKEHMGLRGQELVWWAYLLVTYAIEERAALLYPIYQDVLEESGSPVSVKMIIVEEEGHLEEMTEQLSALSREWQEHARLACTSEAKLCEQWLKAMGQSLVCIAANTPAARPTA